MWPATFSVCVASNKKPFLLRLSPLRSGLQAIFTSSWWVQSCWSHSLLMHSSKLGSFPVQLTSSKWIGPDPIPKWGEWVTSAPSGTRVSPNLRCRISFLNIISYRNETKFAIRSARKHFNITCNQAVDTPPECLSLSSRRHTPSPTDCGKKFLDVLYG